MPNTTCNHCNGSTQCQDGQLCDCQRHARGCCCDACNLGFHPQDCQCGCEGWAEYEEWSREHCESSGMAFQDEPEAEPVGDLADASVAELRDMLACGLLREWGFPNVA